jgi:hypothetical protein
MGRKEIWGEESVPVSVPRKVEVRKTQETIELVYLE